MSQVVVVTFLTDSKRAVRYLGPYQLAWYIRQHGYTSQVLDFIYFLDKEQRLSLYKKFITLETKIVGWAPFYMPGTGQKTDSGSEAVLETLREIKENFPWVKIVIGGPCTRWFIKHGHTEFNFNIDAIFEGESEHSFLEYCNYVFKKESFPAFDLINSIKVIKPIKPYDISSCQMMFEACDFILPGESLPLELSRGCIFKCRFCQYPNIGKNKDDFNKSLDIVEKVLLHHYNEFKSTRYHLADDTLNSHRERTKLLHELSKRLPFKLEFIGYVRLDLIDIWPEQKDILPEAGLTSCHFGIESFDPDSCKIIGKGWGAKNHKYWLKEIKNYWKDDVIINCSFIAGLGKETTKEWSETNEWMKDSGIHDWFYQPLFLNKNLQMSEFERNAETYGYYWPYPTNYPGYWENSITNFKEAKEWCDSVNTKKDFKLKIPSVWNLASYMNQGFQKQQILDSNYVELSEESNNKKQFNQMVLQYYKIAMEY
jgi:hypothetical protein